MTKYTYDENIVSDLHKTVHGFQPNGFFWDCWINGTDDDRQEIWDDLVHAIERMVNRNR